MHFSYLTRNINNASNPSYVNIGFYCSYFARFSDSVVQGAIRFKPLNQVFTAGYLPTEHYVGKIKRGECSAYFVHIVGPALGCKCGKPVAVNVTTAPDSPGMIGKRRKGKEAERYVWFGGTE